MRLITVGRAILDFCYPAQCFSCRHAHDGTPPLCPNCDDELDYLQSTPSCRSCAMPLAMEDSPCPWCRGSGAAHLDRIARLGPFVDPLRSLIHQMKYRRAWTLAEQLADRLMEMSGPRNILREADVVAPVPLYRLRQVSRGYNQAQVIAARLGRLSGLKVARPVIRIRHTETQTHLHSHAQRYENLRDAFALSDPRVLTGKRVVLVDDVLTSGATLHAVAAVVREAKPRSVDALVLAVADPRGYQRPQRPSGAL